MSGRMTDFEAVLEQVYTENKKKKKKKKLGDLNLKFVEGNSNVHNWLQVTQSIRGKGCIRFWGRFDYGNQTVPTDL